MAKQTIKTNPSIWGSNNMIENKFPGKDVTLEDIKSKILRKQKIKIINQNLKLVELSLEEKINVRWTQYG